MTQFFKFLDAYTLRARLYPAIIAGAPALAALALLISWEKIALSNVIATGALLVLLFTLADFARKQDLRIEPALYKNMGGKPSITMMRRNDNAIDEHTKDRYRAFLAGKVNRPGPTAKEEIANQARADLFYEQCGIWLRANTRDAAKFPILFSELVSYGFRRNLLGLKWPALILNLLVVAICLGLLWYRAPLDMTDDLTMRVTVVLVVAAIHALYIIFVVTRGGAEQAARTYARELILSCERLLRNTTPAAPTRRRPGTPKVA
jgi:hypothetical protein